MGQAQPSIDRLQARRVKCRVCSTKGAFLLRPPVSRAKPVPSRTSTRTVYDLSSVRKTADAKSPRYSTLSGRTSRYSSRRPAIQLGDARPRRMSPAPRNLGSAVPDISAGSEHCPLADGECSWMVQQKRRYRKQTIQGRGAQAMKRWTRRMTVQEDLWPDLRPTRRWPRAFWSLIRISGERLSKLPGGAARHPASLRSRFRLWR